MALKRPEAAAAAAAAVTLAVVPEPALQQLLVVFSVLVGNGGQQLPVLHIYGWRTNPFSEGCS
jgi:hypothetical protein